MSGSYYHHQSDDNHSTSNGVSLLQEAEERYRDQSERMIELENALRQDITTLTLELKEAKSRLQSEEIARKEAQARNQKLLRDKKVGTLK